MVSWFKKLGLKFKLIISILVFFIGMFLFLSVNKKLSKRDILNYELKKKTSEIEITYLEKDSLKREIELNRLNQEKEKILEELELIKDEKVNIGNDMTAKELEDFFNDRI